MAFRLIITGAGGRVARMLVPALEARGVEMLLCGRDPDRLGVLFPGLACCDWAALGERAAGHDAVLHLAALNTDAKADAAAFETVNADLAVETARRAAAAGVPVFLLASSVHALDARNTGAYARSKRAAAAGLAAVAGIRAIPMHLAAVHGDRHCGGLAILDRMPARLARLLFPVLAAIRPTLAIDRLADAVLALGRVPPQPADDAVILTDGQERNPAYRFLARGIDLGFALTVLLPGLPLLLALALWVKATSPGPALHAQMRVGRFGRAFRCLKLRTMGEGTPLRPTHDIGADTLTPPGRFLRRSKLDELPQAWNVLKGEMSLVGPRPCLQSQSDLIAERQRRGVLAMRPGITGLAQARGIDMSDPLRLAREDAVYGALRCLALDLRILLATARPKGPGV